MTCLKSCNKKVSNDLYCTELQEISSHCLLSLVLTCVMPHPRVGTGFLMVSPFDFRLSTTVIYLLCCLSLDCPPVLLLDSIQEKFNPLGSNFEFSLILSYLFSFYVNLPFPLPNITCDMMPFIWCLLTPVIFDS